MTIACLRVQRRDEAGAEAPFRTALALDPGFLPALINQSAFEEARGRPEAAEALLRGAGASHAANADPFYALGLLQAPTRRIAEATAMVDAALGLAPDQPRFAYTHRSRCTGRTVGGGDSEGTRHGEPRCCRHPTGGWLADQGSKS